MTDDIKDQELKEFLAGRSAVSEVYRTMDTPEPPPALDRAVLAEARNAVRSSSQRGIRWNTWFFSATVAATIALSITLVLQVTTYAPDQGIEIFSAETVTEARAVIFDTPAEARLNEAGDGEENLPPGREVAREAFRNEQQTGLGRTGAPTGYAQEPAVTEPEGDIAKRERNVSSVSSLSTVSLEESAVFEDAKLVATPEDDEKTGSPAAALLATKDRAAQLVDADVQGLGSAPNAAGTDRLLTSVKFNAGAPAFGASVASLYEQWPAPDVWLAGIRILEERGETERVAAELKKFRAIYPDYEVQVEPIETQ